jgi:3-oxoacyl-[acyl-carrier-protein] synthase-3
VATVTPDTVFPSTSCVIQDRIGAGQIPSFDVSAGCTGAIYALALADLMIRADEAKRVLVVGVEVLTKITNWEDRSTCVLFGDAAGAMVLGPSTEEGHGLIASYLASDGSTGDMLWMPAGGSRLPPSHETIEKRLHYLYMRGNELFRPAVKTMTDSCLILAEKAGLRIEDVDLYVFHQANLRIIEAVGKRLEIPREKVFVNIHKYANTSSATTMLCIHEARQEKLIKPGTLVTQVAFGAGLTWGGVLWRW